jgi:two-component system nitrate/nitrite response regulator NarL
MTPLKKILDTITALKRKGEFVTDNDILEILKATKTISHNQGVINAYISFFKKTDKKKLNKISSLTTRELEVLRYIGDGESSINIAKKLNLSLSTIETHRKNIRKKLGLVGKGKLIEYAIINNFTDL